MTVNSGHDFVGNFSIFIFHGLCAFQQYGFYSKSHAVIVSHV